MLPRIFSKDWKYRTEGRGNAIFQYVGKEKEMKKYVLRLRKNPYSRQPNLEKHQMIMDALFGEDLINSSKRITIEEKELFFLNEKLKFQKERICGYQNEIITSLKSGEIQKDLQHLDLPHYFQNQSDGDVFTCEIKPKWGVKSLLGLDKSKFKDLKKRKCRFCLQKEYKIKITKEIKEATEFCPLDLFCHESTQDLFSCIEKLFLVPQNNFRFFENGIEITKLNKKKEEPLNKKEHIYKEIISKVIHSSNICTTLQRIQLLNIFDIEMIKRIYSFHKKKNQLKRIEELIYDDKEIKRWFSSLKLPEKKKFHCGKEEIEEEEQLKNQKFFENCCSDISFAADSFRNFLISKSARDCSILFTFCRVDKKDNVHNLKNNEGTFLYKGNNYYYTFSIIDLDFKSFKKIEKWENLDQLICECNE